MRRQLKVHYVATSAGMQMPKWQLWSGKIPNRERFRTVSDNRFKSVGVCQLTAALTVCITLEAGFCARPSMYILFDYAWVSGETKIF